MDLEKIKQSPMFIGSVTSGSLKMLPRPQQGEFVYLTDKEKIQMYNGSEWVDIKAPTNNTINTGLSLLEINRSAVAKMKCYPAKHFKDKIVNMNTFVQESKNTYFLMYGKETSYFTLLKVDAEPEFNNLGEAVLECLRNYGEVYSIDEVNKDNCSLGFEIWVKPKGQSTPTILYLFPYDDGVVRFK